MKIKKTAMFCDPYLLRLNILIYIWSCNKKYTLLWIIFINLFLIIGQTAKVHSGVAVLKDIRQHYRTVKVAIIFTYCF